MTAPTTITNAEIDAGGWRPIASAPRDGTRVLLYADVWSDTWGDICLGCYRGGVWHVEEGTVEDNEPDFDPHAEVPEDFDWDAYDAGINCGPTHWMRLPKAPTPPTNAACGSPTHD